MGERWTALVVDDSTASVRELSAALEAAGARVLSAGTVGEAFSLLMDHPIDLAVVDLELPGEKGTAVLQHLRSEGSERVPVVMLSLADDPLARAAAFEKGADDFLVKPVNGVDLTARVKRLRARALRLATLEVENRRLHELSITDGLTQLNNHRHFQERLRDEFRRAQRYDDPLALILLDIDHFKAVNDQHGHLVGDDVLRAIAGAMREAVRETDFCARYGGEEFAVLLPKTHLAGALTVAERISIDVRRLRVGLGQLRVTASFGVSSFPGRQVNTSEQLLKTADEAMFRSKREGRNRISLYQAPYLGGPSAPAEPAP
jgi:diguanylate cyclase (GGDEF)-like protein